jgi:hypothetical protein
LTKLPDETVIDGEVVALAARDRPRSNMLQNYGSSKAPLLNYIVDLLVLARIAHGSRRAAEGHRA